jgi:phosphohistidine phosphatase
VELIIIRHAVAEEREDFKKRGLEDNLRPLTLKGRKKMQKVCVFLRDYVKELDVIVSSPLVRARQTAEIVSQIYMDTKVIETPELVPQAPAPAFLKWLRTQGRNYKRIAIVGHEPHISSFASYMLSGKPESFIDFKKSGIIGLEMESFAQAEAGAAQLMFYLPPKFIVD